jgi:hypothetical protein
MAGVFFPMKNTMNINGRTLTLAPYTEKRRHLLDAVNADVKAYIEANPKQEWDDMPDSIKESFWLRKAQILFNNDIDEAFVANEYFEYGLLSEAEGFFTNRQGNPSTLPKSTLDTRTTLPQRECPMDAREYGFAGWEHTATTHTYLQVLTL